MHLHISENIDIISKQLAEWIVADIRKKLNEKDRYTFVLSGGNTPKKLYETLSGLPYRDQIDWKKMHVFFGDERYVPFGDERNNGKMAHDILLKNVPVPEDQIHYMNTSLTPEESARQYEEILHRYFGPDSSTFDLVLSGMGDDGHTLSLFPGTAVIHEQTAWVAAPYVKDQKMYRITLTAPVVNRASAVVFMVSGSSKAPVLKEVIEGSFDPDTYPSQIIKPANGNLHWFIDEAAASGLSKKTERL